MVMILSFPSHVNRLLIGAIDLHVHSAPDVFPRSVNDFDIARQAQAAGMRACVIKSHFACTAERANLVSEETNFPLYGGLVLNRSVGGLNQYAVEYALTVGAKIVWLPTLDAWKSDGLTSSQSKSSGIRVCTEEGKLVNELYPILEQIVLHDVILATGHIHYQDAKTVVREANSIGVKRILITHPLSSLVGYQFGELEEIINLGDVKIELAYNCTTQHMSTPIRVQDLIEAVKRVGAERCVMTSDAGQMINPVPVRQIGLFIQEMLELGVTESEIRLMLQENPASLLGI